MSMDCREMSRQNRARSLWFSTLMDLHIKLVQLTERGNHLIVISRGLIDAAGFGQIFRKIAENIRSLSHCMVMVDLEDAELKIEDAEFHAIASGLDPDLWPRTNKIALVSSDVDKFDRLCVLSQILCGMGFRVAAFREDKAAVGWLNDTI